MEAAHKDARHAEWLLERQFPAEFAPYDRRPVPPPETPPLPPDLSRSIRFTCGGIDVGEYMRLKGELKTIEAELKAMGALPDFPVIDEPPSTAPAQPESSDGHATQAEGGGRRPIVGAGGRVIGWTDDPNVEWNLP